jgi:hypothetical protein
VRVYRLCDAEKLKSSSDGVKSSSKICKGIYVSASDGVWQSLTLVQIWSQSVYFVFVRSTVIWLQLLSRCETSNSHGGEYEAQNLLGNVLPCS